ncbi:hypothetical protein [Sphingomonas abietis]|uniref:Heme exporter protein D n=1 Tax=Sphingomonas abietis TaxID=3012344 RepID=A0ABY7NRC8_9SPHN|nr:hypothetical protein [Sphingomonas abietis]WBO24099.1 hypothetical protein PBT88_08320 [Sphingomonas abietis]
MNQWPFVLAAYGVAGLGTLAITLASFVQMRRAERAADALKRR